MRAHFKLSKLQWLHVICILSAFYAKISCKTWQCKLYNFKIIREFATFHWWTRESRQLEMSNSNKMVWSLFCIPLSPYASAIDAPALICWNRMFNPWIIYAILGIATETKNNNNNNSTTSNFVMKKSNEMNIIIIKKERKLKRWRNAGV